MAATTRLKSAGLLGWPVLLVIALFTVIFWTQAPAAELEKLRIERSGGAAIPFRVEVVDTPATRARGLMHRKKIAADYGMLFHFQHAAPVSFWMKNTLISLDMIFAGPDGRIHRIHHRAQPGDLTMRGSEQPTRGVLEIRGGLAKRLGIREGDYLRHQIFK